MRVLLDTHALIWYFEGDNRLPAGVAQLLEAPETEAYVSSASFHEIAVKAATGKLALSASLAQVAATFLEAGFGYLPVLLSHAEYLAGMPLTHHKDPFDRMLFAQAMVLLTRDGQAKYYAPALKYAWNNLPPLPSIEQDGGFWRQIDADASKQLKEQSGIPRLQKLGSALSQAMAEHGIGTLIPVDGKSVLSLKNNGHFHVHKWHIKIFPKEIFLEVAKEFELSSEHINKITSMSQRDLGLSFNDRLRQAVIGAGVTEVIPLQQVALIGWEAPNGKMSRFQLKGFAITGMDTRDQERLSGMFGTLVME